MAIMATSTPRAARTPRTPPNGAEVGAPYAGRVKAAELASALGAIVHGAGLALVLRDWLRRYALPLLLGGVFVHGVGMTLKYRLESRTAPPSWWERMLFWGCWVCLVGLAGLIAASAVS